MSAQPASPGPASPDPASPDPASPSATNSAPEPPSLLLRPESIGAFSRGSGVQTFPYVGRWNSDRPSVTTGITLLPPGTAIPLHSHNVEECILVLDGSGVAVIDGAEFSVSAGCSTWVPAGIAHRFASSPAEALRIYWVYGGRYVTRTITATGVTIEHLSAADRGGEAQP
jgi:HTH-type transcriptional regulator, repressor for puuD